MAVQGVPASGIVQAPPPLQVPFVAQPPGFWQAAYAVPAGRGAQVPRELTLHLSQKPHESTLQQTPSVQMPVPHWLGLLALQGSPCAIFKTQLPPGPLQ